MKKVLIALCCLSIASLATAQTVLQTFDSPTTVGTTGGWTSPGTGYSTPSIINTDNNTVGGDQCLRIRDGGWGVTGQKIYAGAIPSNGDYKVGIYYKVNPAFAASGNLKMSLNGSGIVDLQHSPAVTTWTYIETLPIACTAGDATLDLFGAINLTQSTDILVDDVTLEEVFALPILAHIAPPANYIVAGTQTITVTPSGGSGTFTQVSFDVAGAGSPVVDNTPGDGFTFDWDTTAEADGSTSVVIVVSDDASGVETFTRYYLVDNQGGGRIELIANGGFEAWTGGLPDGWTKVNMSELGAVGNDANSTVTMDTVAPRSGAAAMGITFLVGDYTNRYTMMSTPFSGKYLNYVGWLWAKGTSARIAYFRSDDGAAWTTTSHLINPSATAGNWAEAKGPNYNPSPAPEYLAILTHKFNAGAEFWDDISVTATIPPASVGAWELY